MHYYNFHIGDFRSGSIHLTRIERAIYRELIDVYYDTEKPLPLDLDALCHTVGARTEEERMIIAELLKYKFVKTENGYSNKRCDDDISAYHAKATTAKENGKRGGRPPKQKTKHNPEEPSGFPSGYDPVPMGLPEQTGSQANQEPITINQLNTPKPPDGGLVPLQKKPSAISLQAFIDSCKARGERPLRNYAPLWEYVKSVGLDSDMVALAWVEFCRRFTAGGVQPEKRQKDWRITFRKYVENNYFKFWAIDINGKYFLTTQGKQAGKFHEPKDAA
ncbi:YdaU family protein [Undibacterium sp. Ren11W]|uniref:YdaU family protein n=1 Tax=Undibacterium sp. Ren11W TaxID=3413045 RepID=UPI003BF23F05